MLASLHMTAKTAEHLIGFVITSVEEHLMMEQMDFISLKSLFSDLPNSKSDLDSDSSALVLSPFSSGISLPISGKSSPLVILSLQSMESSLTPSI